MVHHGAPLLVVDLARFILVELDERGFGLLGRQIRADAFELAAADEAVAVLVHGLEGQLDSRLLTAKLLEAHFAVLIAIAFSEHV